MSAIDWIADSRLLAVAGWTAIHLTWQLAAIAASAALLGRALGEAPARRHALALAGLGAAVLVAAMSLAVLSAVAPVTVGASSGEPRVPTLLTAPGVGLFASVLPWLGVAWLAYAATACARVLGAFVITARAHRTTLEPGEAIAADYADAAQRVGVSSAPPLVATADGGPALVGWLRPVVVVPRPLFEAMARRDRIAILAHELAHVRRLDHLTNAFQTAALALLGFHPALRWLARVADREREKSCDDVAARAMSDSTHVARALARIALARPGQPAHALSASASSIVERIERLACPAVRTSSARIARTAACGAAVLAIALVAASHVALRDTAELLPIDAWHERIVFDARDPAGTFTLAVDRGRAVAVTLDGVAIPAEQVRQLGQWVSVSAATSAEPLHIRVLPPGAIEWSARSE